MTDLTELAVKAAQLTKRNEERKARRERVNRCQLWKAESALYAAINGPGALTQESINKGREMINAALQ